MSRRCDLYMRSQPWHKVYCNAAVNANPDLRLASSCLQCNVRGMSDTTDHLTDEVNDMLAKLRAAQVNAPPVEALVNAVGMALERKNQLIAILAEAVLSSGCTCSGCVQMREIICS